ncbi:MAG: glycine--tRNA ligase subunit beta [Pseudomonadota bacterium]
MPDLLIELFSEEIPARMQARASEDLKKRMTDGLVEAGLTYAGAAAFATPRRLVLALDGLLANSPTLREERKGPRVDAPDKAIEGFLRGAGVAREDLEVRDEKKGQVYVATITKPGRPAAQIVAEVLEDVIRNFPWPKSMRWGTGGLRWVRPLHSILCILTDDAGEAAIVPLSVDGIEAGKTTEGHRFMASKRFAVTSFEDYAAKLKRAHVVLDPEERARHIWQDATNLAFAAGLEVVEDHGLLREVAGLVEWPVALMGEIGADFLDLPSEVLQSSMREHQKFFSVKAPKTGRIERFVTVANRETADHGATILAGNQKVLAARLADAKFFWENDLRTVRDVGLEGMAAPLAGVTFHNKLGSQAERVARIEALARELAPEVGAKPDLAAEAARIVKADLASEMVYEFPELQGVMGKYYAQAAGHDDGVPEACEEHYAPLGPSDAVPTAPVSVAVALADKLDTLTGFWAIDEKPTGSKDPFALRRAALGVIRLVLENDLKLSLLEVLSAHFVKVRESISRTITEANKKAAEDFQNRTGGGTNTFGSGIVSQTVKVGSRDVDSQTLELLPFFHDRLKVFLRDQGIRHDVIDACIAQEGNDDLALLVKRARALQDVLSTEDGENLVQGFKRANNILTQAEEKDGVEYSFGPDPKFAEGEEEKALFTALQKAESTIAKSVKAEDFVAAMAAMATLRRPIDAFFEAVQINTDNDVVRRNRLNMLHKVREICLQAADLRRLDG